MPKEHAEGEEGGEGEGGEDEDWNWTERGGAHAKWEHMDNELLHEMIYEYSMVDMMRPRTKEQGTHLTVYSLHTK